MTFDIHLGGGGQNLSFSDEAYKNQVVEFFSDWMRENYT